MKQIFCALLCLISSAGRAADFSSSAKGTTSAQFLKLGVGARAVAMGEAYSAVADDASSIYWNPAALTTIPGGALTFMHAPYIDSSFYDFAAVAQNLGSLGSIGLGGQFLSIGKIPQTDVLGNDAGSFNPNDMAVSLGYAHSTPYGSFGLAGKLIRATILNTAQTEAADIGYLSPEFWQDRVRLALTQTNLGGQIKFDQEGAALPRTLRLGSRVKLLGSLISSLDWVLPKDNAPYAALGTEYTIGFSKQTRASLRAGFNTRTLSDLGFISGLSLGMGIALGNVSIDYAFLSMGPFGLTHRFSLSLRWDKKEPKPYSHVSTQALRTENVSAKILKYQTHYARRKVLFQYHGPDARTVEIIGDFNQWDPEPMAKKEDGTWYVIKEMPDGVYHYNFKVDGQEITDPWNQNIQPSKRNKVGSSVLLLGSNL